MPSKLQNLSFGLIFAVSVYILAAGIPSQLRSIHDAPEKASVESDMLPPTLTSAPLVPGAILFKASGEEVNPPGGDWQAYISARDEFEKRFGSPFDEAWKDRKSVHHPFDIPDEMADMVNFWIQIFSRYGKDQYVFHHRNDVSIVYSVLDLSGFIFSKPDVSPSSSDSLKNRYLMGEKSRLAEFLRQLNRKLTQAEALTPEEERLAGVFFRNRVSIADSADTDLIRVQGGFAHKFREAIIWSGRYMKEMENIFSMKGLPVELTRLPFIESAFNISAVSSAKAVGLWQFIPETGKRYLKIDEYVDERRNPVLSTYAAAAHLAHEFEMLKSWPLTINAYNTGPGRMLKAIEQLGTTDIFSIIRYFRDPGYQFYSRNYFPEFLAALHVYEHQEDYFGNLEKLPPLEYDLFVSQDMVDLKRLSQSVDVDEKTLIRLNPGFSEDVLDGTVLLPPGYLVYVPKQMGRVFAMAAANQVLLASNKLHVVRDGESLDSIAALYNIPAVDLERANNFLPAQPISAGMVLNLPVDTGLAMKRDEGGAEIVVP